MDIGLVKDLFNTHKSIYSIFPACQRMHLKLSKLLPILCRLFSTKNILKKVGNTKWLAYRVSSFGQCRF